VIRWLLLALCLDAPALATTEPDESFEYLYIVANEDGSSGGHAAVRLGHFVYHFQNEEGLLVLKRDRAEDFLFNYALLENRAIHVSRVDVSPQALSRIIDRFRKRHRAQEAQIAVGRELSRDRELLERLVRHEEHPLAGESVSSLSIRGLGYFVEADRSGEGASRTLASLKNELVRQQGSGFLDERRRDILRQIHSLGREDPLDWRADPPASAYEYPPFDRSYSSRWVDLVAGLAAIEVLERTSPLDPTTYRALEDDRFALSEKDLRVLRRFADASRRQLLELFDSRREDWGQTVLVAMARLVALERSIEEGRLVFLDSFPDGDSMQIASIDPKGDIVLGVREENRRQLEVSWAHFRNRDEPDELAWERLEERGNRYSEILRAVDGPGRIRVQRGHLVPARSRRFPIPISLATGGSAWSEGLDDVRRRERDYIRELRRIHRYGLITRNCVTALFDTLNESFEGFAALSEEALGGYIDGQRSLAFIPFVSAHAVNERYRVSEWEEIPSYREARLREMKDRENPLWLTLRESNTFSARSYRPHPEDSFFIFFTDRTLLLRPVLGAFNLVAGLGESIFGLFAAPVDRGRSLVRGLRGTFVSLPELAFWNIRKGSYGWIPPEHRGLEPARVELGRGAVR
jgi:hypothetical protein